MRLMVKTVKEEKLWNMQPWFSWDTNVHTISICCSYATTSYKKPSNYPLFSKFLCLCIILSFENIPYESIFYFDVVRYFWFFLNVHIWDFYDCIFRIQQFTIPLKKRWPFKKGILIQTFPIRGHCRSHHLFKKFATSFLFLLEMTIKLISITIRMSPHLFPLGISRCT